MLDIKVDGVGLYIDHMEATPAAVDKAARRAINKTVRWAKVQIAREAASRLNMNVGKIKKALVIDPAKSKKLEAVVSLSRKGGIVKAIDLGAARQRKDGVRIRGRFYKGAFLARMPGGHQGVFRRKNAARLPIQELFMLLAPRISEIMEELGGDPVRRYLERTFQHELKFALGQL